MAARTLTHTHTPKSKANLSSEWRKKKAFSHNIWMLAIELVIEWARARARVTDFGAISFCSRTVDLALAKKSLFFSVKFAQQQQQPTYTSSNCIKYATVNLAARKSCSYYTVLPQKLYYKIPKKDHVVRWVALCFVFICMCVFFSWVDSSIAICHIRKNIHHFYCLNVGFIFHSMKNEVNEVVLLNSSLTPKIPPQSFHKLFSIWADWKWKQ